MEVRESKTTGEIYDFVVEDWMVCFCFEKMVQYFHNHEGTSGEHGCNDLICKGCDKEVPKQIQMMGKLQYAENKRKGHGR